MTELLNKEEAAKILKVAPLSMNRLMHEIGYVRVGRRSVRFTPESIETYIKAKSNPPRPRTRRNGE